MAWLKLPPFWYVQLVYWIIGSSFCEKKCSGVEISKRNLFVSEIQGHCRPICLALLKFHKTLKTTKMFIKICNSTALWASWISFTALLIISFRQILILSHLGPYLPKSFILWGVSNGIFCTLLSHALRYMNHSSNSYKSNHLQKIKHRAQIFNRPWT